MNKYGDVNLPYICSLLPDKEEDEIISDLDGRIYYNPLEGGYEIADRFISGNVVEKAEQVEWWLENHPGNKEAKRVLKH